MSPSVASPFPHARARDRFDLRMRTRDYMGGANIGALAIIAFACSVAIVCLGVAR